MAQLWWHPCHSVSARVSQASSQGQHGGSRDAPRDHQPADGQGLTQLTDVGGPYSTVSRVYRNGTLWAWCCVTIMLRDSEQGRLAASCKAVCRHGQERDRC